MLNATSRLSPIRNAGIILKLPSRILKVPKYVNSISFNSPFFVKQVVSVNESFVKKCKCEKGATFFSAIFMKILQIFKYIEIFILLF